MQATVEKINPTQAQTVQEYSTIDTVPHPTTLNDALI